MTWLDYTADRATNRLTGAMYDNSGELTSYQSSSYTWDVLGQVTSVNSGSEFWTHTYDAKGERNPPNAVKQAVQNDPKIIAALKKALKYLGRAGD